jgi:hypothetical protein
MEKAKFDMVFGGGKWLVQGFNGKVRIGISNDTRSSLYYMHPPAITGKVITCLLPGTIT